MRLERHDAQADAAGARRRGGRLDDRDVALVDAVEIADRHGGAAASPVHVGQALEDLDHAVCAPPRQPSREGGMTTASPSTTGLSLTRQVVESVTRRFARSMAVTSHLAVTVSPGRTGALNFSVCET